MPVKKCQSEGKPGYKCGDSGKCYTYTPGNERSRKSAKRKAILQCRAMDEPVEESDYDDGFDEEWFDDLMEAITKDIELMEEVIVPLTDDDLKRFNKFMEENEDCEECGNG